MGFSTVLSLLIAILPILLAFANGFQECIPSMPVLKADRSSSALRAVPLIESATTNILHRLDFSLMDPIIKSEVFSTAAHVSLDLGTFAVNVTPLSIQFLAVIGRLFCIASDYVPDHTMLPEEFAYQLSMLAISSTALVRSLNGLINANRQALTIRDRKCFAALFRPSGVTIMQFKMIMATALEWKEFSSGSIIASDELSELEAEKNEEEECLYWLYDGELEVQSNGKALQTIKPKSRHLFGDLSFAVSTYGKKRSVKAASAMTADMSKYPLTTTKVKSDTAKILRIDTRRLKELMAQDQFLDQSIHNMLFDIMQERISDLIAARQIMAKEQEKRHRTCFELVFQSTGISWKHYKSLLAQSAVELHHAASGKILVAAHGPKSTQVDKKGQEKYLHWVCEGELKVHIDTGRVLQTWTPATGHLFGDLNSPIVPSSLRESYESAYPNSSVRVGKKDSIILRVDSSKIKHLMDEDKTFSLALHNLMYIQEQMIETSRETREYIHL